MNTTPGFHIYINQSAGAVQNLGEEALRSVMQESGVQIEALYILPAKKLFETLKDAQPDHRILVGGGDGTITGAASILSERGMGFGIIPLGTMDLLARDLDIPIQLNACLQAYAGGTTDLQIDAAYANDQLFLCSAGIGLIPDSSHFREDHRSENQALFMPRLTWFVFDRLDPTRRKRYKVRLDDRAVKLKSASLVISNNQYTHVPRQHKLDR